MDNDIINLNNFKLNGILDLEQYFLLALWPSLTVTTPHSNMRTLAYVQILKGSLTSSHTPVARRKQLSSFVSALELGQSGTCRTRLRLCDSYALSA